QLGRVNRLHRLGAFALKNRGRLLDQTALPLVNLGGMHLKTLGQFADGLALLDCLQGDTGLERRLTDLLASSHRRSSLTAVFTRPDSTLIAPRFLSSFWGPL